MKGQNWEVGLGWGQGASEEASVADCPGPLSPPGTALPHTQPGLTSRVQKSRELTLTGAQPPF